MDDRKIQPIPMNEREKMELKTIARVRGGQSMASAAREVIHETYLAIVTQPANGEEQVVGIAEVTKNYDVTTVENASETNPTLRVGIASARQITNAPARMNAEAFPATFGERNADFDEVVDSLESVEKEPRISDECVCSQCGCPISDTLVDENDGLCETCSVEEKVTSEGK